MAFGGEEGWIEEGQVGWPQGVQPDEEVIEEEGA